MYTGRSETTSRFSGASRAFGLPPPKADGAKRIYFGGRSPALTRPHFYYGMEMIII